MLLCGPAVCAVAVPRSKLHAAVATPRQLLPPRGDGDGDVWRRRRLATIVAVASHSAPWLTAALPCRSYSSVTCWSGCSCSAADAMVGWLLVGWHRTLEGQFPLHLGCLATAAAAAALQGLTVPESVYPGFACRL